MNREKDHSPIRSARLCSILCAASTVLQLNGRYSDPKLVSSTDFPLSSVSFKTKSPLSLKLCSHVTPSSRCCPLSQFYSRSAGEQNRWGRYYLKPLSIIYSLVIILCADLVPRSPRYTSSMDTNLRFVSTKMFQVEQFSVDRHSRDARRNWGKCL